jgi:acetyl-CoA C-acetyltransferase
MPDVVICEALRTPIGKFEGALSGVRPDDLLADLMKTVVARTQIDPSQIDDVFMGCANQAGEDNRNVARMALLLAGIPESVPGVTVNRLCASGLEAVNQAFRAARVGDGSLYLAGGVESMSRAPYSVPRGNTTAKTGNVTIYDTSLGWRYPNPRMEAMFPLERWAARRRTSSSRWGSRARTRTRSRSRATRKRSRRSMGAPSPAKSCPSW